MNTDNACTLWNSLCAEEIADGMRSLLALGIVAASHDLPVAIVPAGAVDSPAGRDRVKVAAFFRAWADALESDAGDPLRGNRQPIKIPTAAAAALRMAINEALRLSMTIRSDAWKHEAIKTSLIGPLLDQLRTVDKCIAAFGEHFNSDEKQLAAAMNVQTRTAAVYIIGDCMRELHCVLNGFHDPEKTRRAIDDLSTLADWFEGSGELKAPEMLSSYNDADIELVKDAFGEYVHNATAPNRINSAIDLRDRLATLLESMRDGRLKCFAQAHEPEPAKPKTRDDKAGPSSDPFG
jgi:hypothetical protein